MDALRALSPGWTLGTGIPIFLWKRAKRVGHGARGGSQPSIGHRVWLRFYINMRYAKKQEKFLTVGERRESNPQPSGPQPDALPIELRPPYVPTMTNDNDYDKCRHCHKSLVIVRNVYGFPCGKFPSCRACFLRETRCFS